MLAKFLCPCVLALFLFACNDGQMAERNYEPETMSMRDASAADVKMEAPRTAEPPPPPAPEAPQQKIIYTADVRARVTNLDSALVRLTDRVSRAGGFVSSQHLNNSTHRKNAELVIRLPAGELNQTMAFLPQLTAEIDYQNLDSRNVTAEWLDLESRLQTKREVRDRYVDILRNRAQKVEDILNAEDKIRVITEEIEAKEGQLRYLRDQVSLSTLSLTLYETIERRDTAPATTYGFGRQVVDSLAFGWEMVQGILLGVLAIWPLILLGMVGVFVFRRWRSGRS